MRLLFLSNFYPPADRGGWEQWCQEIADAFTERGHQVAVLTSRYGLEKVQKSEANIYRSLYLESDLYHYRPSDFFLAVSWRDRYNRRCLTRIVQRFHPDVLFIWGMWQLNPQLAVLAERLCPARVAYYFCGYWPIEPDVHTAFWQRSEPRRWVGFLKRPLSRVAKAVLALQRRGFPEFRHVACVSEAVLSILRSGGLDLPTARVIYGGIRLGEFYRPFADAYLGARIGPLRLLYAGSITPAKGVDTAVQAMARLAQELDPMAVHLTIVGAGQPDFQESLRRFVQKKDIERYVTFQDRVHKDVIHQLIQDFDVLVFPSTFQEPLARMMMEGMAAGLVLVGTTTGGSKEVLEHGRNSLTFAPGDAEGLAWQIRRLLKDPLLAHRLALAGQRTALDKLDFDRMVDELESFVIEIAQRSEAL